MNIFAVYKPKGMTSHDVINILRKKFNERRIGHAGTLDPLAEGVLVVAVGRENTKKLDSIVQTEKEYVAEIKLGTISTTEDEEGDKEEIRVRKNPDIKKIKKIVSKFIGYIKQRPSSYSAIKIDGKRAYKLKRQGKKVKIKKRKVLIKEIEILEYSYPILKIRVICGKGVYIRALARDIGKKLRTGGYLKSLLRTRVGEYTIENARDIV